MGICAREISDVSAGQQDQHMMGGAPLAQPIQGGVANDGRLVFADDALSRLHHRAGGVEGGVLAIPGLAAMAALTHQLKMRLSRAVKVADANEDLELWVEVSLDGDVARLSILSWRPLATRGFLSEPDLRGQYFDALAAHSALYFDAELRLISADGEVASYLDRADFGKLATDVLKKIANDDQQTGAMIEAMHMKREFVVIVAKAGSGDKISISGTPQLSSDGAFTGYRCDMQFVEETVAAKPAVESPGALFGRQLAPVLRQPLGRIIANAETIGSELNGPIRENYALYAKDIANAARHLVALVDDLGDLEAVERTDFITAKDNIELGDVARRVAGLLALKAADHSVRIVTPTDAQKVPAVAEFRRVLQILLNLVTNAVRYSPDGTEVFIDIATLNDASLVMVSDQGAGIAPADRERVFEKFERLGRSGDGGSGLGLYISRRLARAMGGELTVDSAASGGAKFTLRLPSR
jgi:nitrogen-specific signal transduction histidine kinase